MLDDDDDLGNSPRSSYATSHLCTPPPSPEAERTELLSRLHNPDALDGFVFPVSPTGPHSSAAAAATLWWTEAPTTKTRFAVEPVLLPTEAVVPPDAEPGSPFLWDNVSTPFCASTDLRRSPPAAVASGGSQSPKYLRRSNSRSSHESHESLVANPPTYLTSPARSADLQSTQTPGHTAHRFPRVDDGESTAESEEVEPDSLIPFHASASAAERRRTFGTSAPVASSFSNRSGSPPGASLAATKRGAQPNWDPASPLVPAVPPRKRAATQDGSTMLHRARTVQVHDATDDQLSHTLPVGAPPDEDSNPVRSISSVFLSGFPRASLPSAFDASPHSPRSMSASVDAEACIIPVSRLPDQGM